MTKRDFFRLVIKIFGFYFLILTVFTVIPDHINFMISQFNASIKVSVIANMIISVGLFLVLLFRTDSILNNLKLDKGFDEDRIDFGNLSNQNILKVAIIIIGGFLILDQIPDLIFEMVNAFKYKSSNFSSEGVYPVNYFRLSINIINVVIGFLMINNYKAIAQFLDKN